MNGVIDSRETSRSYTCGEDRTAGRTTGWIDCEENATGEEDQRAGEESSRCDEGGEYAGAGEETVKGACLRCADEKTLHLVNATGENEKLKKVGQWTWLLWL